MWISSIISEFVIPSLLCAIKRVFGTLVHPSLSGSNPHFLTKALGIFSFSINDLPFFVNLIKKIRLHTYITFKWNI